MSRIRVVLVDQNSIFRAGLKLVLEDGKDIIVIAQYSDIGDAIVTISSDLPHLVVLELPSDNRPLVGTIDNILLASAETRILLLTDDHGEETQGAAILAGAHGVISKDQEAGTLRMAIKKVHDGEAWIDRTLTSKLLAGVRRQTNDLLDERQKIERLTPKELEITKLIALGMVNKTVGNHLDITEKTVRNHLTVIFSKLGVSNRLELAIYASNNGIKSSDNAE